MKKGKIVYLLAMIMILSLVLVACGKKEAVSVIEPDVEVETEMPADETAETTENVESEVAEVEVATDDVEMPSSLPELGKNIEIIKPENEVNDEIATAIISHFEIPEEYLPDTRYYYNYYDFNNDGKDEIFAIVVGTYTSGTGGVPGIMLDPQDGMKVMHEFNQLNTPIIVSNLTTNEMHDIIVPYGGGGAESTYKQLKFSREDKQYPDIEEAWDLPNLDEIKGVALIYDELLAGTGITMAK